MKLTMLIILYTQAALAAELHSHIFIDTGVHYVNTHVGKDTPPSFAWPDTPCPDGGIPIPPFMIKRGSIFFGIYMDVLMDLNCELMLMHPNGTWDYIFRAHWDHYANPTGADSDVVPFDFHEDWMTVNPGDKIVLVTENNGVFYTDKFWGMQITLQYTYPNGL